MESEVAFVGGIMTLQYRNSRRGGSRGRAPSTSELVSANEPDYGFGYADRRRAPNWRLLLGILLFHIAIMGLALNAGYVKLTDEPRPLQALFVPLPPASPPAPQKLVPPKREDKVTTQIIAPRRLINLSSASRVVVAPEVAVAIVAAPASPTEAAPVPPAPIVAPDFRAGQLGNPGPKYPYLSRKGHEEGVVLLRVLVGTNGRALSIRIESSSGHSRLDKAALATVKKWRFTPATQSEKLIDAWVLVPVTFRLG